MKLRVKNLLVVPALITALGWMTVERMTAQTFTTLHQFSGGGSPAEGANPNGRLVVSGDTLFGTTYQGGAGGSGTVFAIHTNGTSFTNIYHFTPIPHGSRLYAGLVLSNNILYGTAAGGGAFGNGTVFSLRTDGTGFTNLHSFTAVSGSFPTNSDGRTPLTDLFLAGSMLYGVTGSAGELGYGTVYKINVDGTDFTTVQSLPYNPHGGGGSGPTVSGNMLYGTGSSYVYAVGIDGTGFTNLYNFTGGSDGGITAADLLLSGDTLYGATVNGGSSTNGGFVGSDGSGTLFSIKTNGTGFTVLHTFTERPDFPSSINSDGYYPLGELLLKDDVLYGTTVHGGSYGYGTVFAIKVDGTEFVTLHHFANSDGANPVAGLVLSGRTLYGITQVDNISGAGTVFSLSLAPRLTFIPAGTNVVLTWPTHLAGFDYAGYTLQSTTNLVAPVVWTTSSPAPVVVNGQNIVTNSILGTQKFYRLSQ